MADAQDFSNRGEKDNVISTLVIVPSECLLPFYYTTLDLILAYAAAFTQCFCGHGSTKFESELSLHFLNVKIRCLRSLDTRHIMPGDLSFLIYHGQGREAYDATIGEHHLVLTTYGTVVVESKRRGALFLKNWYRIVLDEG